MKSSKKSFKESTLPSQDEARRANVLVSGLAVVSRKKPSIASEDETHRDYLFMKKLYRQFQGFVRTLADIRETVGRINAMLEKMNKESDVFWTEFKRDFPEMKLDDVKTQNIQPKAQMVEAKLPS